MAFVLSGTTRLLAFSIALHLCCSVDAAQLAIRRRNATAAWKEKITSVLTNHGDVEFTMSLSVGGQDVQVVVDTGSFRILVLSSACGADCGPTNLLYDESKSNSYEEGSLTSTQSYGSGDTHSVEARETFGLDGGAVTVKGQRFWKVYKSDMELMREGHFQGILGVGPPASVVTLARRDVEAALKFGRKDVDHYREVLKHAEDSQSFVEAAGIQVMSVCLDDASGGGGKFMWNDERPEERSGVNFQDVAVEGDLYWSADLTNVKIGNEVIGCGKGHRCSGIVDSGTSLIVAPASVCNHVKKLVAKANVGEKGCHDLNAFPDLEFALGGQLLSLPPESYIGKVDNYYNLKDDIKSLMPQLLTKARKGDGAKYCESLLMSMDEVGPRGQEWIFGLPLFRKYYTTFVFGPKWEPQSMHFAEADDTCEPASGGHLQTMREVSTTKKRRPLVIDASKLRVPEWVLSRTHTLAHD
eukprot:TRINITY_DN64079_c0_g1_i1.p1 TRINITY_DN64079_c0_g1~~TRINITY_DN64079_c0_g1_i1.p1  ORF type:complete len:469 (+),score=102.28 TRINITY_DN64079_c0_g1_i1:222-1628(+)